MHRDIDQLSARTFDVLVVGGGIYGLTIAYDAAQRGLSVALIERRDFGSGASFNHLRTIHGGLRYLQDLDLARARESIRERRTLARIAPEAVRPVPFVLPLTPSVTRGMMAMRAGFLLDRLLARDRNTEIPETHHLPAGRVVGRAEALNRFPVLQGTTLTGAAVWYDYVTTEADRLTLSWALAAAGCGAVLANYVEALELRIDRGRVTGARAIDHQNNRRLDIDARLTVNATGSLVDRLLTANPQAGLDATGITATDTTMLKAMNVVTRCDAPAAALGSRSSSGRNLFLVPWKGRALFGTWESAKPSRPDDATVESADLSQFVGEIGRAFPAVGLTIDDVTLVHRGNVPAVLGADGRVTLEKHEIVRDHAAGLISVVGTKYTTARGVAQRVTDQILSRLGRPAVPCRTANVPLPVSQPSGDAGLIDAVRSEMALTLEDALVRRTPIGALGYPGEAVVSHAAEVVGRTLGWSVDKQQAEIDALRRFYAPTAR